jgi:hypothetical protein
LPRLRINGRDFIGFPKGLKSGSTSGRSLDRHREDLGELRHLDQGLKLLAFDRRQGAFGIPLEKTMHTIGQATREGGELRDDGTRDRYNNGLRGSAHDRSIGCASSEASLMADP